ncbi:ABC transporter permease [Paenibacillus sp. YN15]|uniref:ABC transporter permease n=1 Tax=Paenibacillus sp. YN15 TaxID=1742774 RepID=UPI000DCB94B8|nr:ABC transporter permease [Paenibacillus sp. YN15]RAU99169.1 ABC transporter permease [Paenibacillus sp. YN15]
MTFRHIILQNLKHNLKRFLSYLFVNSFVVAVLFLYGSLLFNDILAQDPAMRIAKSYIDAAAYAIVIFSVVFVSYTGIYFVKSRGREFGLYLTLGMTTRDLSRMIRLENLVIVAGSAITGLLSGMLLSRLFYLILGRILAVSNEIYSISYKTFLLSLGVFLFVFSSNVVFTGRFLRKLSIVQIAKAASTKGISKPHPVVGCLAIVIFSVSLWIYHAVIAGGDGPVQGFIENNPMAGYMVLVFGIFGALFFVLAFCMDGVRMLLKRFPSLYNRHILILTNLSHRFNAYKVSLYLVTLLITLAMVFMGFGLTFYSFSRKTIGEYVPYDYMVEASGGINRITGQELQTIVADNGGTLASFSALEFIHNVNYRNTANGLVHHRTSLLISESEFNRHTGLSLELAQDELVIVYNVKGQVEEPIGYDTVIAVEPWEEGINRAEAFRRNPVSMDEFLSGLGDAERLVFERGKTTAMYAGFINSYGDEEFKGAMANIVNDSVYAKLRAQRDTVYLFNLKAGDGDRIFAAMLDALREKNQADSSLWTNPDTRFVERAGEALIDRNDAEALRPVYKAERQTIVFRINGFLLFALSFLGVLFLLSSSIVLYYKVATDIDEEKEQAALLMKIGLTAAEYRAYLRTHLAIIFFAPMIIGGLLGLFLITTALNFTVYSAYLKSRVFLMYGIFVVLDIFFYLSLKNKFVRGVGLAFGALDGSLKR